MTNIVNSSGHTMAESDDDSFCKQLIRQKNGAVIAEFQESLCNVAFRITGDCDQARDVVQDVYLKYLKSPNEYRGTSSLKTYFYRVVVNRCIDLKRRRSRFDKIREALGREQHTRPEDVYEIKDIVRRVFTGINSNYKVPFVLAEVDGMSYEEIAGILQIKINTVRTRIFRCRQQLRKKLLALGYPL